MRADFLNPIRVTAGGRKVALPGLLHHHQELADALHVRDRVHTYGSFSIADLVL